MYSTSRDKVLCILIYLVVAILSGHLGSIYIIILKADYKLEMNHKISLDTHTFT